jgi:hypothetical protein
VFGCHSNRVVTSHERRSYRAQGAKSPPTSFRDHSRGISYRAPHPIVWLSYGKPWEIPRSGCTHPAWNDAAPGARTRHGMTQGVRFWRRYCEYQQILMSTLTSIAHTHARIRGMRACVSLLWCQLALGYFSGQTLQCPKRLPIIAQDFGRYPHKSDIIDPQTTYD